MRHILFGLVIAAGLTSVGEAQVAPAVSGLPWVGCWEAADVATAEGLTCVLPESGVGLRIVALAGSGARSETVLRLDGAKVPLVADGCTGWQRARLTPAGDRLLLDGETTCERTPRLQTAGVFVIMEGGDWVQAQGGGIATVVPSQIRRFRPVANTLTIPADLRGQVGPYLAEAEQARARVQGVPVTASDLLELERMGTPTAMLDFVVAASYPDDFVVGGGATGPAVATARRESSEVERRAPMYIGGGPAMSYFDWAMWNGCAGRWGLMDPVGCGWFPMLNVAGGVYYSPYARFGAAWPYGGGWYGNPYGGGIIIRPIVTPGDGGGSGGESGARGGRMVRGRGYVQDGNDGGASTPRAAQPRGSSVRTESSSGGSRSSGGSSSGGSSSGGSSAGSSGGGGSSAPRTAKPRDP